MLSTYAFSRSLTSILRLLLLVKLVLLLEGLAFAQSTAVEHPKITGYVGILHPLVSFSEGQVTTNFKNYYQVGFPIGLNLWKSEKVGFSAEFVPFIRAESGQSRMSNFLFHPGALLRFHKGYVVALRAAFETSGRYGFTPVLSKTVIKKESHGYFVALLLPLRFGNNHGVAFTPGFQFGINF
ncbi:hypothetical protein [Siphonobacter sp. SORGH_AS_0500]|uniref:hypothetical protein n=1 Tax=Siphonobacter sp. SORGH_AS_0500 TaxID=1864824 RepID=UPI002865F8EC|nr:hypothetical protein [Siphonobacter sp. SORGH_AS_0500]MDR6197158.1 hypothetical protein [Siphonobacter sp. SORGH_AS_0500]